MKDFTSFACFFLIISSKNCSIPKTIYLEKIEVVFSSSLSQFAVESSLFYGEGREGRILWIFCNDHNKKLS